MIKSNEQCVQIKQLWFSEKSDDVIIYYECYEISFELNLRAYILRSAIGRGVSKIADFDNKPIDAHNVLNTKYLIEKKL